MALVAVAYFATQTYDRLSERGSVALFASEQMEGESQGRLSADARQTGEFGDSVFENLR